MYVCMCVCDFVGVLPLLADEILKASPSLWGVTGAGLGHHLACSWCPILSPNGSQSPGGLSRHSPNGRSTAPCQSHNGRSAATP